MKISRREMLMTAAMATLTKRSMAIERHPSIDENQANEIERIANTPVLDTRDLSRPVILESLELLKIDNEFLVRARTRDGAESVTVPNSGWMPDTFPIFKNRIAPYLIGKDVREVENLLVEAIRQRITYKMQGLPLWVCVAAAEMAILDLLGQIYGKSIGQLFGGVRRDRIAVYRASGRRGNAPEDEVEHLQQLLEETGGDAVKFRLGAVMSGNRDSRPGRSEALIPMVREKLGDKITLYADANSSYDAANSIRLGKLMQAHDYAFLEEPCRFDDLWETKRVADGLELPIAGGEQESSLRRFQWTIMNRGLDVIQPDLHYFGGYLRTTRVARMAAVVGIPCTPHMSGWGLGYLNALHLMSFLDLPAKHLEFKGYSQIPFECDSSSLKCDRGFIRVPSGPGFGIKIDPNYVKKAKPV